MQLSPKKIKQFQKEILTWYAENKRDFSWRRVPDGTPLQERAYKVLISEVMSQQTQISRVVPKFEAWMQKFPTIESLAEAKVSDVLQYWSGLGYNRRALNLKKTAEIICNEFGGIFPQDEKLLLQLPGIGKYTARAILCFAFDEQIAVVDTNIRKVILTQIVNSENSENQSVSQSDNLTFRISDSPSFPSILKMKESKVDDSLIEEIATQLLPAGRAYDWNQALMDYAAAVLKKEKIQIPKQSKFIGSHRYYRGQVLKYLLQNKAIEMKHLGSVIKKDYSLAEEVWLQTLVQELIDEGFIIKEKETIVLVS